MTAPFEHVAEESCGTELTSFPWSTPWRSFRCCESGDRLEHDESAFCRSAFCWRAEEFGELRVAGDHSFGGGVIPAGAINAVAKRQ